MLIAIEGVDGAGKNTLSAALTSSWSARGVTVASMAFPRYGESVHADLAAEALTGGHGDLASSVNAMAVLFALDRAGAAQSLRSLTERHDVVLLDRYVASNAAFSAARCQVGADSEIVEWVRALEFGRLGLPVPDVQVLLGVPVAVARERARTREQADAARTRDAYERDSGLQERTAAVYSELAASGWVSPWHVLQASPVGSDSIDRLAAELLGGTASGAR